MRLVQDDALNRAWQITSLVFVAVWLLDIVAGVLTVSIGCGTGECAIDSPVITATLALLIGGGLGGPVAYVLVVIVFFVLEDCKDAAARRRAPPAPPAVVVVVALPAKA